MIKKYAEVNEMKNVIHNPIEIHELKNDCFSIRFPMTNIGVETNHNNRSSSLIIMSDSKTCELNDLNPMRTELKPGGAGSNTCGNLRHISRKMSKTTKNTKLI